MRFVLLAIAVTSSACVIDPGESTIAASWTIEHLDTGETRCPANWDSVVVVTSSVASPELGTTERFRCEDGHGHSAELEPQAYVAWLEFRDKQDALVATSLQQQVEAGALSDPIDARVFVDAGYVGVSWTWEDKRWCDDGWNPFQAITLTLSGGPGGLTQIFSCHDDRGITSPVAPGTYQASIGQGFSRQTLPDLVVEAPNRVTQIPRVTL